MIQSQSKIFVVLLTTILVCAGCEKDELHAPSSPLNGRTTAVFNSDNKYGKVTDVDGNVYKTITIGKQTWMAENLRVSHYQNGDTIPNITATDEWSKLGAGAFCNYNNTLNLDTIATYGRLYNWYAVTDSRNIAPKGWRAATPDDWNTLVDYLGGDAIAGGKLKEAGNLHWFGANEADNSSGFTAMPGGDRYFDKESESISLYGVWWTSGQGGLESAAFLYLFSWDAPTYKGFNFINNGYSIRCIKE